MSIVFLDRDGVINEFPGMGTYATRWEQIRFVPRAKEAIARFTKAGYHVAVISNQGCVSHGMITQDELNALTARIAGEVMAAGGRLDAVYYCIHRSADDCECKKPKTGLLREAMRGREENPRECWFVGDSREDVLAGKAFGCRTLLVLSGRTKREDVASFPAAPDAIAADLWEAADWILSGKS